MAEKEATVYIVELAKSMGIKNPARKISDLDWALQYVWDKITTTVQNGRKTTLIGVVGLGTDETNNDLGNDQGYEHISILQPISQILMPQLQRLPTMLQVSQTNDRDVLSSIIIGVDMIIKHCKKLQYKKKIVVITNATGRMDDDDIESTAEQIKKSGIELVILGIDFDDQEYGYKEEAKSPIKAENEKHLKRLINKSGGVIGTMQEAIDGLSRPSIKLIRSTPTYTGQLRLGDPEKYDTAITIDIQRYFKTLIRRAPTASSYAMQQDSGESKSNLTNIHNTFHYWVNDNDKKQDIPREELAKGYEYGSTAVHISESDENITKLETDATYEIIGFIPADNVERYSFLDNSNMLVAQKVNEKAALALSSLIHALFELDSVAVCRFVKKDMSEPILTLLSPSIEEDIECLIENVLPFAEDIRTYRFPPLDKVLTMSGQNLSRHRNLPTENLLTSMSDFVDSMKLSEENMTMDDTFSPVLHTIEGAIRHRAMFPNEPLPTKSDSLVAYSKVPSPLESQSQSTLSRLLDAAELKKVPPKVKGRKRFYEAEKPLSGLDVGELLRKEKRIRISPDNAIPEFKQQLATVEDITTIKDIVKQMSIIIENQIQQSYGDLNYDRVVEGLGEIRKEMLDLEEPILYNDVLQQVKTKILKKELGGERKELWWKIRNSRIGLIDKSQSSTSDITREEGDAFFK